jgi:PelA/Pel-15E family pectate lyase
MLSVRIPILSLLLILPLHASVIGTNTPAMSLTVDRITAVPASQRGPWLDYLKRSATQMAADKASLAKEREGLTEIPGLPKQGFSGRAMPLDRDVEYYKSDEARKIGDVILSFQTPGGGWSKNLDFTAGPRLKGQLYATANLAPVAGVAGDFDKPKDETWHYISTLDNDATNTEIHFLAKLVAAAPGHEGDAYRASILRGLEYLLRSQYPNGGWPQVWPLEGGYHDAITFNDDAVTESAESLTLASEGKLAARDGELVEGKAAEDYSFVPAAMRVRARAAVAKALKCILATQVSVAAPDGKGKTLTVWAQQNDPLTLEPVSARNYEMPSLSSGESASVMLYLMSLPKPSAEVMHSLHAAAAWFESSKIMGYTWSGGRGTPGGRKLTAVEGAGPLWARYYSLTTGKPIFGDRDKSIHDDVMELSLERRNGYGWYGDGPKKALSKYAEWNKSRT